MLDRLASTGDMQMLLHGGDRQNPLMRVLQLQPRLLRLDGARLDEQDAGDDLQAVGDAVLHLLQQHFLFPHQLLEPAARRARRSVMSSNASNTVLWAPFS